MNNIRKYRIKAGLSLQKLGNKIGTSRQYLSVIEKGKSNCPVALLEKISTVLKVNKFSLLGEDSFAVKPATKEDKMTLMEMLDAFCL